MKTFEVEIRATIRKNMFVEAPDAETAHVIANENFNVLNDGSDEHYEQETLSISEVHIPDAIFEPVDE